MFTPTLTQVGLILAGLSTSQAPAMQPNQPEKTKWQMQLEQTRATFPQYLDDTETTLNRISWAPSALINFGSRLAGYNNVSAEEMVFVRRFFENKEQKQRILADFLKNHALYKADIDAIYKRRDELVAASPASAKNLDLLFTILHERTVKQLGQPETLTRVQMAQKAVETDNAGKYTIPDEKYFRQALINFFCTHMLEKCYL